MPEVPQARGERKERQHRGGCRCAGTGRVYLGYRLAGDVTGLAATQHTIGINTSTVLCIRHSGEFPEGGVARYKSNPRRRFATASNRSIRGVRRWQAQMTSVTRYPTRGYQRDLPSTLLLRRPQEIPMPMEKLEKPNASLDTESHISASRRPFAMLRADET